MIKFEKFELNNGLRVIVHEDNSTPLAVVNMLYDVGSRDENENKTGFAHLFEHLMFEGSVNIPEYDKIIENAGGSNNAFTSNDLTNYYITLPAVNLETAFWLESDRMLGLAFSEKSLDVQKRVVIEEFRQQYLNKPYGDAWLLLSPLAYRVHPYRWQTIGKDISHIQNAKMRDVKDFFYKYYRPDNAIMVVAGNVKTRKVLRLAEKWFGPVEMGNVAQRSLPQEPVQKKSRFQTVKRKVPYNAIYKAYHTCSRTDPEFHASDLLSDILSNGQSSRLYEELVKNKKLFSDINAYSTGNMDKGLFVVSGKLVGGTDIVHAESAIVNELEKMKTENIGKRELCKVKNKAEASLLFSEMNALNKAINLAASTLMGDTDLVNKEVTKYNSVTSDEIRHNATEVLKESNCSTLYYLSEN